MSAGFQKRLPIGGILMIEGSAENCCLELGAQDRTVLPDKLITQGSALPWRGNSTAPWGISVVAETMSAGRPR